LIRNEEIIPVDGVLINGIAMIDYSFVTGESVLVLKRSGDKLFAGGKQTNGAIEMEAIHSVKQSYLTQLWSNDVFKKNEAKNIKTLTDSISKQFTIVILSIALIAGIYWYFVDRSMAFQVVSAILIIACPCALALSAPFALGNMIRIFGKKGFYLKNTNVIEAMSKIDSLVFDKTGTITSNNRSEINYYGDKLKDPELAKIKSLLRSSNHPLSRMLYDYLEIKEEGSVEEFTEVLGKGIKGVIKGITILLGSPDFTGDKKENSTDTVIYVNIEDSIKGKFVFKNFYREGLKNVFSSLESKFQLTILSGDNEGERTNLQAILPNESEMFFNQKPEDKLHYIESKQLEGKKIMMLGDGLNDAGALAQSNVGIAISENINVFSPACDGILDAKNFDLIPDFIKISHKTIRVVKMSFIISFIYNIVGLLFAVTGNLSPIVAAILMPISSISVVIFATISTNILAKKILY